MTLGLKLDQFWRCPVCDSRFAMGEPARLHPPFCSSGHARTEMEQTTAKGFGRTHPRSIIEGSGDDA